MLALTAIFLVWTTSFAQQKKEESASTTLQFMNSSGSFMVKEFYDLATIKGVACKVLIITDVATNKKVGCMRLETTYRSSNSITPDTYKGYDSGEDEIAFTFYIATRK